MIVDDSVETRSQLAAYFNRHGIETVAAANASEARKAIANNDIALATIDVIILGENRLELTKWINMYSDVPTMALSFV